MREIIIIIFITVVTVATFLANIVAGGDEQKDHLARFILGLLLMIYTVMITKIVYTMLETI